MLNSFVDRFLFKINRAANENFPLQVLNFMAIENLKIFRGTQRQFSENICSEDDLRSRIFGAFVVKFLACLPLLGFSNI